MFGVTFVKQYAFLEDRVGLDMLDVEKVLFEADIRGFRAVTRAIEKKPGEYAWYAKFGYKPDFDYGNYTDEELIEAIKNRRDE